MWRNFTAKGLPLQLRMAFYYGIWMTHLGCIVLADDRIPYEDQAEVETMLLQNRIAPLTCWCHPRFRN